MQRVRCGKGHSISITRPVQTTAKFAYSFGLIFLVLLASPFIIIGAISYYRQGTRSTIAQRAWTMSWVVFGQFRYSFIDIVFWVVPISPARLKQLTWK
ncbi:hypothetical protein B0J14DRAFT_583465 [Halenospora varia]|nr:hypothetical protein B0J14DRAFT_583465 [Halenospora varia]